MCSKLGCSFSSFLSSSCRENRYLLFLTENYAALQILKRYLQEKVGQSAAKNGGCVSVGGARGLQSPWDWVRENRSRQVEPLVLFGSSFPKDKTYTQVCVCLCVVSCINQCTCASLTLNLLRCVVSSIKSRYAWKQVVQWYWSTWTTCMTACMTCSTRCTFLRLLVCYNSDFVFHFHVQNYLMLGSNRYVDIGMQTHRVKCRVHKNFKLVHKECVLYF